MPSAVFKGIEKQNGKVYVRVGKISREFETFADVKRWARSARGDFETLHKLLVDVVIGDATDIQTVNANIGKQITFDMTSAQKITVT